MENVIVSQVFFLLPAELTVEPRGRVARAHTSNSYR
jgi:hypothetical protein